MLRYNTTTNKFEGYEDGTWTDLISAAQTSVNVASGTAGAPSYSFSGDADTGFYSSGSDTINITAGGTEVFNISSAGLSSPTTGGGSVSTAAGTAISPTYSFSGDEDTGWYRASEDNLAAATNGVERVRIGDNGNVGIGTTAPVSALDVSGTIRGTGTLELDNQGALPNSEDILFQSNDTDMGRILTYTGDQLNSHMGFYTSNSGSLLERVRINNVGNVGIGTTAPSADLEVVNEGTLGLLVSGQSNAAFRVSNTIDVGGDFLDIEPKQTGADIHVNDISGQLYLSENGNVGVGTTAPISTMHINDGPNMTAGYDRVATFQGNHPTIQLKGGSNTNNSAFIGYDAQSSTEALHIWTGQASDDNGGTSTAKVSVTAAGNVGIGTTSPSSPLSISSSETGDGDSRLNLMNRAAVSIKPHASNSTNMTIGQVNNGAAMGIQVTNGPGTADWDIALNPFGGNVGVGTTTPQTRMTVEGPSYNQFNIRQPGQSWGLLLSQSDSTSNTGYHYSTSGNDASAAIINFHNDALHLGTSNSARMTIDHLGNVGIGTTTPQNKLEVSTNQSGGSAEGITIKNSANGWGGSLSFSVGSSGGYDAGRITAQNSGTGGVLRLYTADTSKTLQERLTISNTGNVGIGKLTPEKALDVTGDIQATGRVYGKSDMWREVLSVYQNYTSTHGVKIKTNIPTGFRMVTLKIEGAMGGYTSPLLAYISFYHFGGVVYAPQYFSVGTGATLAAVKVGVEAGKFNVFLDLPSYLGHLNVSVLNSSASTTYHNFTNAELEGWTFADEDATDPSYVAALAKMSLNNDLHINSSGNVGIGTTSPGYKLHVNGSVAGVGAYNNLSDKRLKRDIASITTPLNKLLKLRGVTYEWRREDHEDLDFPEGRDMGVIAQEVRDIFPEAVSEDKESGLLSVAYSKLIAPIIESLRALVKKDLQMNSQLQNHKEKLSALEKENRLQKEEISSQKSEIDRLKLRLESIEKALSK